MKVLHIIASLDPAYGGPVAALAGLTQAQKAIGMEVGVIATQKAGANNALVEKLRAQGITVRILAPASGPLLRHPQLGRIIEEGVAAADVVHIHGLWEEIQHQAASFARRLKKPYIIRPCGMLDPWSLNQARFKKQLYRLWRLNKNLHHAAALHFASQIESDSTQSLKLKAPSVVQSNGISLEEFEHLPPPGTFRKKYPQIGDNPLLVFLGRIHPGKGLEHLIPALARLEPANTVLAVVGPDSQEYRATIESQITKEGLSDRVIFTGSLYGNERIAALADADLFALPSAHENFGIAVVEALAAGTPVIISDQVAIHADITAAGAGSAVPLDVDALAQELTRWLQDDALRQAAAARARPFVREQYDWLAIAQRWTKQYADLIS